MGKDHKDILDTDILLSAGEHFEDSTPSCGEGDLDVSDQKDIDLAEQRLDRLKLSKDDERGHESQRPTKRCSWLAAVLQGNTNGLQLKPDDQ